MDPVSSFGLAASVYQLLQCAEKLIQTTSRLRQSADGVLGENHEIEMTATDLVDLVGRLPSIMSNSTAGEALRSICNMSSDVAGELLTLLDTMKVADTTKRWDVARKAFRSMLKDSDKKRLLERLGSLRTQLTFHMQGDLVASVRRMDKKLDALVSVTCATVAETASSEPDAVIESMIEVNLDGDAAESKQNELVNEPLPKDYASAFLPVPEKTQASATTIQISQTNFRCGDTTCSCFCHLGRYVNTPQFLRRLIGSVTYRGTCANHPSKLWELKYWTPSFLSNYNVYMFFERAACGTPGFALKLQRKVAWGGEDTIIKFAFIGDVDGIKNIIDKRMGSLDDVDPNHGRTPLHYAVMKGHIRAVKLLLDAGADRLAEDTGNTSAEEKAWEHILTNRGSAADLSQLRVYFPDYDIDRWGFSNLHKAILGLAGHLNSVMLNPPAAFDIDAPDVRGRTPLHWAALRADLPAVSFLLDAGASVHAVDLTNSTPLSYAVSSAIPDMVQLLIRHGANVNAVNNRGDSPLHYAARHKDDLRTVKMLVNAGALVDSRNSLGNTPFAGAAITNRVAAGRYLLGRGADRHSANMYGDTPLRETVQHNCHDFLKMLLDGGTRYDDVNKRGSTVLHTLALEGDTRTAEILIAAGVEGLDPERRNGDGKAAMEVLEGRARLPSGFNEAFTGLLACLKASSG